MASQETNEKIDKLLLEYDSHRDKIRDMILDVEKIKEKIDILIPDSLDARYMRFFEEKVKSVTALYGSLLDMRKEITKSIKDEIEIRRKVQSPEEALGNLDDILDIRSMVSKIDEFKAKKTRLQEERFAKMENQKIDPDINIPGISTDLNKETHK